MIFDFSHRTVKRKREGPISINVVAKKIIDCHAHLEQIRDLEAALSRAKQAQVVAIVAVSVDLNSCQEVLKISRNYRDRRLYPQIYPALGMHPGNLQPAQLPAVIKLIEENMDKIAAIGEIGLDFWYKQAKEAGPRKLQEETFLQQLDLAKRYNKPVIIHSRGAWRDCLTLVVQQGITQAVFHWYSGPQDVLQDILKQGYFISATASCEYSREHRQAIEETPLEKLLLETDAPVVFKGESGKYQSEPKDVLRALKAVAQIKDVAEAVLAQKTLENAREFFSITLV